MRKLKTFIVSGSCYPSRTLYGIFCGLKGHLKDENGGNALNPLESSDKWYFSSSCTSWVQCGLRDFFFFYIMIFLFTFPYITIFTSRCPFTLQCLHI